MNFFEALWNFIRCTFCSCKNCYSRYSIGSRHYYSYLGSVKTRCPKERKHEILSAKELRNRILENTKKEENKND